MIDIRHKVIVIEAIARQRCISNVAVVKFKIQIPAYTGVQQQVD